MSLEHIGWNDTTQTLLESMAVPGLVAGRVVRVDRGLATVDTGERALKAARAGAVDPGSETGTIAVGDWVALEPTGEGGVIRLILPRSGVMSRRRPGAADMEQAIAANIDRVLVVESLERGPNPRRIERAAALAWDGGATPVVVLTKAELCRDLDAALDRAREGAPYSDVVPVSSVTGDGIDSVREMLIAGTTAVLLGPSGVGKSSLINRLLGEQRLAVGEVRAGDHKGRHTTTHRELVTLPGGGCIIDTPGIRELGLWLDRESVTAVFPEIEDAAQRCRFNDCRHDSEPGCAVREAVADGTIDARRLDSFLRLQREAENLELRRDLSRRHELRARERSFGKMVRAVGQLKNRRG